MTSRRGFTATLFATAAVTSAIVAPEFAQAQTVSDRVLSDVSASTVGTCSVMTVTFNIRVQVLSFFPQTSGRELHIRVKPLEGSPRVREALRSPSGVPALRSIEYDGDNTAGPVLSLFFTRDVHFDVKSGDQPQNVIISVNEAGDATACTSAMADSPRLATDVPISDTNVSGPQTSAQSGTRAQVGLYVINAVSQAGPVGDLSPAQTQLVRGFQTYETRFDQDGQTWHRVRVGFFETRAAAEAARVKILPGFPDSWVVKVSADERAQGLATPLNGSARLVSTPTAASGPISAAGQATMTKAVADAQLALKSGENDRSIQLLTTALAQPENELTPRALELYGLTRERKGQFAQARATYEDYLKRYPSGESFERVKQRLEAVVAATPQAATPELRAANGTSSRARTAQKWRWGTRGSFSQFYFQDRGSSIQDGVPQQKDADGNPISPTQINQNQFLTNADVTFTGGDDRTQLLLRAAGSYTNNFRHSPRKDPLTGQTLPGTMKDANSKSLSALYFDYSDTVLNLSTRIGRQTKNGVGVFGRFDGAQVGWQFKPRLKLNLVGGFPVDSSRDIFVEQDRYFYGVSADFGARKDNFQATLYWFDQRSHGLIDRRSVGTEMRYIRGRFNAFTLIDYDVHFNKLNLGLVSLNYNFKDQSSLSITADYRQSPLLSTTRATGGQVFPGTFNRIADLRDLQTYFTDAQIKQLALFNVGVSKSLTVSYARPVTSKLQANFDVTVTDTGGTPDITLVTPGSAPILGQPKVGKEYYYGAQLIGTGLAFKNDIWILSSRYANTQSGHTYSADVNARFAITNKFRLSPRARYGVSNQFSGTTLRQFQPTLRLNYYPIRQSEVEIEIGANFAKTMVPANASSAATVTHERGLVFSAGYRLDF
jgi:hypothetical protein